MLGFAATSVFGFGRAVKRWVWTASYGIVDGLAMKKNVKVRVVRLLEVTECNGKF